MIEKMKVVHIVTTVPEKADMLTRLRALGIVHFSEKAASDPRYPERFAALSRMATALQEYPAQPEEALLSDEEFESFFQKLSACLDRKKALQEKRTAAHASAEKLAEWGRFSPAEVEELRSRGWDIHIYRTDKKTLAALTADPDISFVRLASVGKMPTLATFAPLPDSYSATEFPLPEKGLAELELEQEILRPGPCRVRGISHPGRPAPAQHPRSNAQNPECRRILRRQQLLSDPRRPPVAPGLPARRPGGGVQGGRCPGPLGVGPGGPGRRR